MKTIKSIFLITAMMIFGLSHAISENCEDKTYVKQKLEINQISDSASDNLKTEDLQMPCSKILANRLLAIRNQFGYSIYTQASGPIMDNESLIVKQCRYNIHFAYLEYDNCLENNNNGGDPFWDIEAY